MTGNPEVMCTFLASDCVQVVYKKAGLKGLKMDLSNAESTTDSWATGPNIVGEPLTSISLYGGLAYFAIVRKSPFGTRQHFSEPLTAHDVQITFRRSWKLYGPGSTKMQHLSWKVQCFG